MLLSLHQNKKVILRVLFEKATDEELKALKDGLIPTLNEVTREDRDEVETILKGVCEKRGI